MERVLALLKSRGVSKTDIIECVYFLQRPYHETLTNDKIIYYVDSVLNKREVQHAIYTGIALDVAVEKQVLDNKELEAIIARDDGLYGVDEVLAYGICNLYGSIALTNFGYIDKMKPGIIGKLNRADHAIACHTFLDDIVGAIAAAAASKLAHDKE
ncbi:MAG: phosphatidylglycerophosphatase A [Erysipelothrix sp.]|nr:phosphatidylglycerophosphatase A [Erysipelothrix sp.]